MPGKKPTVADAQLILQLYELRREPEMRKARDWCTQQFLPASRDEVLKLAFALGTEENRYLRQFLTYYEMVASFVNRGLLNRDLLEDSVGEHINLYAKLKPFLKDLREQIGVPEFMQHTERLIEGSPNARRRLALMQKRIAERMAAKKAGA
jgi:hypothetical protein